MKKRYDELNTLRYIEKYIKIYGYPPAIREICSGLSINSTSTVYSHLRKLESEGYIKADPTKSRAINVLKPLSE